MQLEGPMLESLTRRLAETPEDFLAEPRIGLTGRRPARSETTPTAGQTGCLPRRPGHLIAAISLISAAAPR